MRKLFATAAVLALMAAPASAFDIDFGGSVGLGGVIGGTADFSGAGGFAGTLELGNAHSLASNEAYGMSESNFKGSYNAGSNSFRLQGGTIAGSGSLSNAAVQSSGNGFGAAAAGGAGFGLGMSGGLGGAGSLSVSN